MSGYTKEELIALKPKLKRSNKLPDHVFNTLKSLDLLAPTKRGTRAGFKRKEIKPPTENKCNKNNLIEIELTENEYSKPSKFIDFAVFNARSVRNKSAYIQDFIIENNLDILCLTETE